jgi:glycosyltransferase involved in cell wall biosynthesis
MRKTRGVLFVIENNYYPRDTRVYNECTSLAESYRCYVLAPRKRGQKFIEQIEAAKCYRYPHFEADSLRFILVEYLIAAFWIALLVPLIVFLRRIRVVHVANPPDILIPLIWWVKVFRAQIIFDVHDLSVETFRGKGASKSPLGDMVAWVLDTFESLSIYLADTVIATNESIRDHVRSKSSDKPIHVVRNSNPVLFAGLEDVKKQKADSFLDIGYFGLLAADEAAGLDHLIVVAKILADRGTVFRFSIVGTGPGLERLKREVSRHHLEKNFAFYGFVPLPQAFDVIKNFDFGIVPWGDLPKNHFHTAMKVMDYMCCAVPVCSLLLKEQLRSTKNIGIHAATFQEIADRLVEIYTDPARYEELRRKTLDRFNGALSWDFQRKMLIDAYARC